MTVWIQEVGGSPKETYSRSDFSAVRTFLVLWNRREEFVRLMFSSAATYPGQPQTVAVKIVLQPLDTESFDNSAVTNAAVQASLNRWAKAIVSYGTVVEEE